MTTRYPPSPKKEQEAKLAAQAAEKDAYRTARQNGRTEDSATKIACVAYERTYRRVLAS